MCSCAQRSQPAFQSICSTVRIMSELPLSCPRTVDITTVPPHCQVFFTCGVHVTGSHLTRQTSTKSTQKWLELRAVERARYSCKQCRYTRMMPLDRLLKFDTRLAQRSGTCSALKRRGLLDLFFFCRHYDLDQTFTVSTLLTHPAY